VKKISAIIVLSLIFDVIGFSVFAENKLNTQSNPTNAKGETKAGTGEKTYSKDYTLKIEGEYSEKFVLGHGDCGGSDCKTDRGRVEREIKYAPGKHIWYKFSFYLDKEWDIGKKDILSDGTTASIAQVKVKSVRPPIWMLRVDQGMLKLEMNILDKRCPFLLLPEDMMGKWNQIILYANYSKKPTPWLKDKYLGLWINEKQRQVDNCANQNLLGKEQSAYNRKGTSFRYGLYHSYVSRELNQLAKEAGVEMKLKGWNDKGGAGKSGDIKSFTNKPWKIDWPVKMKTKRIWFDDMVLTKSSKNVWNLKTSD